jgi:hypothetical protein
MGHEAPGASPVVADTPVAPKIAFPPPLPHPAATDASTNVKNQPNRRTILFVALPISFSQLFICFPSLSDSTMTYQ